MSKYLNVGLLKNLGVVGTKRDNKLKIVKIPISDKTYEMLRICKFTWWNPSLAADINSQSLEDRIEDNFSDVFYRIVNNIIENKLGITPREFDILETDLNDNEILIDIEVTE